MSKQHESNGKAAKMMSSHQLSGFTSRDLSLPTGMTIHIQERIGVGTPVILVHGIWGNCETWSPILDLPSDPFAGRPIWSMDLRGHGHSSKPSTGYSLSDYAVDLAAVIEQRPEPQVIVCGHSLGALTSILAVQRVPNRIAALILEEPPLPIPTDLRNIEGFWATFAEAVIGLYFLKQGPRSVLAEALAQRLPDVPPEEIDELAGSVADTANGVFTTIMAGDFGNEALNGNLNSHTIPTLVFQGTITDERALTDEGVQQVRQLFPNIVVVALDNTDHSIHSGKPNEFGQEVKSFLDHLVDS